MYLTRDAAGAGRTERDSRRRESESGEDAAHALRRVAQDAAGLVPIGDRRCDVLARSRSRLRLRTSAAAQTPPAGGAPRRIRARGVGRDRGHDAHDDGVARRRPHSRQARAAGRRRVAGALVDRRAGRQRASFVLIVHDVDARDRQRHRRRAALDGVEHPGDGDVAAGRRAARSAAARRHRDRSARAGRTIADRRRRRRDRRITTCSSCSRSTR